MARSRLGGLHTPKPLKILTLLTAALSLTAAILEGFFPSLSLRAALSLSQETFSHMYIWQLASYLLVYPAGHGISFSFLINLAFNLYVLWMVGTTISHRKGLFHFFSLYSLGGLAGGIAIASLQYFFNIPDVFSGNWTALYALLMGWVILYPEVELLFLLTLPIKGKWLVLSLLGINLLIDISTGAFLAATGYLIGAIAGYLYAVPAFQNLSPFSFLHPFERMLIRCFPANSGKKEDVESFGRSKIYDFKTGKAVLNDKEFLEAMLTKISMRGIKSLSFKERWRLKKLKKKR